MSVIEDKTYYAPNFALNLDLRPFDQSEWSKFDGYIQECRIRVAANRREPCGLRMFFNPQRDYCPRCGNCLTAILSGDELAP